MAKHLTDYELALLRKNVGRTDRQIGEIIGMEARDVLRERLRLNMRKSWVNAWNAGRGNIARKEERRDRFKRVSSAGKSREKMVIEISDVRPTGRPEIVEVIIAADGRPVRLRRDMVEFFQGRVVVPLWLGQRIMAGE